MTMTIKRFEVNALSENCYVVSDETKECVIIDCGCSDEYEWADIKKYLATNDLQVKHLLNTHLHFDHVWGNTFVYRDLGLRPEANYEDLHIYEHMDEQIRSVVGVGIPHPPLPPLGTSLLDGGHEYPPPAHAATRHLTARWQRGQVRQHHIQSNDHSWTFTWLHLLLLRKRPRSFLW